MAISKVWLDESEDECICCGNCEQICPEVFEVPDKMVIRDGADLEANAACIVEAESACPTGVIKHE